MWPFYLVPILEDIKFRKKIEIVWAVDDQTPRDVEKVKESKKKKRKRTWEKELRLQK